MKAPYPGNDAAGLVGRDSTENGWSRLAEQVARYQAVLMELARWDKTDLTRAFDAIAKLDAETMGVARVGIWFFTEDGNAILCRSLYDRETGKHGSGVLLEAAMYPAYFRALRDLRVVVAEDALTDPSTREFRDGYLIPNGIVSMLDIPVWRERKVVGVVCHEHRGEPRAWTPLEQQFAASIADMVALTLETAERRHAEDELRRREQQLLATQQLAGLGSWQWDVLNDRVTWTDELYRIYGLDADTFAATYEGYLERVHPDDRAHVRAAIQRAFEEGGTFEFEERIVRPDGDVRVLHSRGEVFSDDAGRPIRLVGACHDITARKRAEEALQRAHADLERRVVERTAELARTNEALQAEIAERLRTEEALARSEEHFRLLIEKSSDIATIIDRDGITRYESGSIERLLGYTADELIGKDALAFVHQDDRAAAAVAFARLFEEPGRTTKVEFRFRHKDGSWRWLEGVGRVLRPDEPDAGIIVNTRDITERKEVESALRRSEEHFRSLIENGSDVIGVVDPTGTVLYTSPSTERVLGRRPDEMIGRSAFDYIHPEDVEPTKAVFSQVIKSPGTAVPAEFRMRHEDGSWRLLEAMTKPLVHDGIMDGMVVNARDMTERKRAEDALQRAKREAEQSREIAERANRAKSEFLSRMSHELRTPMNSILGFAQVLSRKELPTDQRKAVDHILKAGRHLLNLINEVLDISRIEANRQQLSLEPVRVHAVVQETLNLIRPLAAQRGVVVREPATVSEEWHVQADRQRLAQVLLNLLSNAAKYNRRGGSIEVGGDEAGGRVRVWVRDTGPGIAADKVEQLFVPFERLGAEQSDVEGTGLGLALSKRLVEAMGGRLRVASELGVGTTLTIDLPHVESPLERLSREAEPVVGVAAPSRTVTVLYIEDNLANLALIETILLMRPEVTLIPALQGQLGLDLAWEHDPDVILLDLHLPDIAGQEVLRRLRADERTRTTPVVVISADATDVRIETLTRMGAQAYLTKPLEVDRFLATLDEALQSSVEEGA